MGQHIRILTVEDSTLDAELVERELRRAKLDFSCQRVEIEPDFRAALESSDPDVILADYNLPRFDGISALNIAHALVPETPFIFVSGSIGEERAAQAVIEVAAARPVEARQPGPALEGHVEDRRLAEAGAGHSRAQRR